MCSVEFPEGLQSLEKVANGNGNIRSLHTFSITLCFDVQTFQVRLNSFDLNKWLITKREEGVSIVFLGVLLTPVVPAQYDVSGSENQREVESISTYAVLYRFR